MMNILSTGQYEEGGSAIPWVDFLSKDYDCYAIGKITLTVRYWEDRY